jgi:hypothetical protein
MQRFEMVLLFALLPEWRVRPLKLLNCPQGDGTRKMGIEMRVRD